MAENMYGVGYSSQPGQAQQAQEGYNSGSWQNITFEIKHRNTNSIVDVHLGGGDIIKSRPGTMVHMSPTVGLQGKIKVNFKRLLTGAMMDESTYTGPGNVALAPKLMGDIMPIYIEQQQTWNIHKEAWLGSTADIVRDTRSQGFKRAIGSGGDLFVYHVTGTGVIWVESFGAVEVLRLQEGQQHIVERGHLVAWNCQYTIELAGGRGIMNAIKTDEGAVCRFTGPGLIYYQTRNLEHFAAWVREQAQN